jgi:hypothetical protein
VARRKRRRRHNQLRPRLRRRKRNATTQARNVISAVSSRNNDGSKTISGESSVRPVHRKLNALHDLCDSNSRKVNASQHRNSNNGA